MFQEGEGRSIRSQPKTESSPPANPQSRKCKGYIAGQRKMITERSEARKKKKSLKK